MFFKTSSRFSSSFFSSLGFSVMTQSNEEFHKVWLENWKRVQELVDVKGQEAIDAHALQIGRINILWNNLHERFCDLFYGVSGLGVLTDTKYLNAAHIIWREFRSDRAAREMLRLLVPVVLSERPKACANIDWVLKQTGKLSDDRDAAAHVPLSLTIESSSSLKAKPDWSRNNRQAKKLSGKDFENWLQGLHQTLVELSNYTDRLLIRLVDENEHSSWPERPLLPHLGQKETPKKSHPKKDNQ